MYGEVVERVVVSHRRPEFPDHTPPQYRSLAERCWASDAAARPTFAAVLAEVESMLASSAVLQAQSDMLYASLTPPPPPPLQPTVTAAPTPATEVAAESPTPTSGVATWYNGDRRRPASQHGDLESGRDGTGDADVHIHIG
ncbi:hypothetical protein VOLCADRAFT_100649 [Volvox carteri f. nagariensis]|uniref:Serine-threonine/tyrosine-protein kinase catalytic domain-containing protein n=1 Tax=Volvox carteri f. nagariensis TaxID=3068 RepID=D8UKQ5_VOLCA|nr:uncharacterized protein VOLCADRAFT_100649 [Volvox carteri f. nagariensis]EFJ39697.1 hypothetical protein VOLCADRAFT_100649 [Volvox carteri f. nagariensis]|eukprot:XP_002959237.1 hypothetical protein VOLCADRAFT_100649 [Volvox carteri f. nagariensis]